MDLVANAAERRQTLLFAALDRRWVFEAPVNPLGAGRKHRAVVARVIADGHHVVHRLARKLVDGLRAVTRNVDTDLFHNGNRFRPYRAWFGAGAEDLETPAAFSSKQPLPHLRSSGDPKCRYRSLS